MPAKPLWVVLDATEVNGPTIQVPKVLAKLIGLRADLPSPGNGIAFLDTRTGVLRVAAVADPWVGATPGTMPMAVATPTKRLLFCLPKRVKKHLGLGWRPVVAWIAPEREWGEEAPRARVFLVSSSFPLLPPQEAVEAAYTIPRPA